MGKAFSNQWTGGGGEIIGVVILVNLQLTKIFSIPIVCAVRPAMKAAGRGGEISRGGEKKKKRVVVHKHGCQGIA